MRPEHVIRAFALSTLLVHAPMVARAQGEEERDPNGSTAEREPAIPPEIQAELAELRAEVEALKKHDEERELAELEADAETYISAGSEAEEDPLAAKTFKGGERSLQKLNPEISVVGDLYGRYIHRGGEIYADGARTGAFPRVAGVHLQANLDPFSFAKVVVGISPAGVSLGEIYITWNSVTPWLSLTLGRFHQQFGVVNRWHAPGLDQFLYPAVILEHFGGPLTQTGLSALFLLPPCWADHLELEIQVTNGENERLFSGEFFSVPSGLVHFGNYWDLNRDTYLELGLSGVVGVNNAWGKPVQDEEAVALYTGTPDDPDAQQTYLYDAEGNPVITSAGQTVFVNEDDSWHLTLVGGADLTLNWEPVDKAKYRGVTWRTEFLYAYKEIGLSSGGESEITSWGLYSYVQVKPVQNWILGVRGDITQPFSTGNSGRYTWGVVPYITWWQSPWVRFRLEYDYIDWAGALSGDGSTWLDADAEHRVVLQVTFSAGPHKHERY